jgi:hypothetical protein
MSLSVLRLLVKILPAFEILAHELPFVSKFPMNFKKLILLLISPGLLVDFRI